LFITPLWLYSSLATAMPWKFEIDPYIWAINMNGRVGVGPATAHVDESFHDILKDLNFAAMVYAAAHKDKFGLYVNIIYAVTSTDASVPPISIDVKNKLGIFGAGISYIVLDRKYPNYREIIVEPYAGARYTLNNTTVNISHFGVSDNVNWTDPVIGLRLTYNLNKKWYVNLSGDIGGTNHATDCSYSAMGLLGFEPWEHTGFYLGYRLLSQHYQKGTGLNFYNWDMKLFGPLLGFRFTF
jgi:hypothetical protein